MRIEVQSRTRQAGIDNVATVERRTRHLLDRLDDRIQRLEVQLVDLNGPKGGVDRQCRVSAKLVDGEVLHAEAASDLIPNAVDRAIRKLARRITDRQHRRIDSRRRRSRDGLRSSQTPNTGRPRGARFF